MRTMLTALGARRDSLKNEEGQKGFTLIELLVVVIIIGILAAIAIPVYMGIQDGAKDSAAKSDLVSNKTAVIAYYTEKGAATAPTAGTVLVPYGWVQSTPNPAVLSGATGANAFNLCVVSESGKVFKVNATTAPAHDAAATTC